jgi:hypothetical protein
MKVAAISSNKTRTVKSPTARRRSNPFSQSRDWNLYEGFPNASITTVSTSPDTSAVTVTILLASGNSTTRTVGGLAYVVGRRGTLSFLSPALRTEIMSSNDHILPVNTQSLISGRSLRAKAELSLEVARNIFITGSLTGDSLIRHSIGGCVFAAGRIMDVIPTIYSPDSTPSPTSSTPRSESPSEADSGLELERTSTRELTNGHADLHVDRRTLARSVEVARAENRVWVGSGWWAGGLGPTAE